jgi:hypothetical protein
MPDTLDRDTSRNPDNLNPSGELFRAVRTVPASSKHPTISSAAPSGAALPSPILGMKKGESLNSPRTFEHLSASTTERLAQ